MPVSDVYYKDLQEQIKTREKAQSLKVVGRVVTFEILARDMKQKH